MRERYTHRNGETEAPTEPGRYEFFGKRYDKHLGAKNILVDVEEDGGVLCVMESYPVGFQFYQGRWWGPVTPPWETKP